MRTKWNRISSGDIGLFMGRSKVTHMATVTHKFQSEKLADMLWERKTAANGGLAAWEYMYAFNQPDKVSISYDQLREALDGLALPYREFSVMFDEPSARIVSFLENEKLGPPPAPTAASTQLLKKMFDDLEKTYKAQRRLEQSYLRQFLTGALTTECSLCGREFDTGFLVAAHIKKRSHCTDDEKRDIPAIAMLACKFGCDELYKKGMVVVDAGTLRVTKRLTDPLAREYANQHLKGRKVLRWADRSASHKYFQDHLTFWSQTA